MNSIKLILQKVLDLVKEIEIYEYYKENLIDSLEKVNKTYLRGELSFDDYQKTLHRILGNHSKTELIRYYNSYIFYLLKKVEFYNSQIFYIAYRDDLYKNLRLPEDVKVQLDALKEHKIGAVKSKVSVKDQKRSKAAHHGDKSGLKSLENELSADQGRSNAAPGNGSEPIYKKVLNTIVDALLFRDLTKKKLMQTSDFEKKLEEERQALHSTTYDSDFEKKLEGELDKKKLDSEKKDNKDKVLIAKESDIGKRSFDSVYDRVKDDFEMLVPKPLSLDEEPDLPKPTKHTVTKFFSSKFESLKIRLGFKKEENDLAKEFNKLGLPSGKEYDSMIESVSEKEGRKVKKKSGGFLDSLKKAADQQEDFISSETKVGEGILAVAGAEEKEAESSSDNDSAMMREAHHMKLLLESQENERKRSESFWERYNLIDKLLNVYVKKLSLKFIESFPGLFKNLYEYLRFADIKMLSNTYVNLMIFVTLLTLCVSFPVMLVFSALSGTFILAALVNSAFWSILLSAIVCLAIYNYPSFRIKTRRRSINSNLPFAINHMAAVAASGVPPTTMFKLIAMSDEYGEVSKEIRKISDYIAIFGYDVLTSVKQVSSTTPARSMKEFLDGFVSTVEAGGDLVNYLKQKSDESMLSYNLERQKYNETISTYSDIYTGIMIAAPLFFMSTLSIVNLMGGKIGNIDVNSLLAIAIYLVLPGVNLAFLLFVHYNQPEV